MDKSTKYCQLTFFLKSGIRITGTFHIPIGTSSTVRPSDAIRTYNDDFLLLTEATVHGNDEPREYEAVLIRLDAVSHIELPPTRWVARPVE